MPKPEFDITIDQDGKLHVHVKGAPGPQCLQLADLIRDIIGTEESRKLTSEYYDQGPNVRLNVDVRNNIQ